jgi:hypothetical protein
MSKNKKSGTPRKDVKMPTGIMIGEKIVLEAMSAINRMLAPVRHEAGIR